MATPQTLRRALGALKDTTKVGLAKVNSEYKVALKTLIVIHRLLREGDPTFREELCSYTRSRGHVLNMSNFKDDSSPSAWDYSAWVRTYALYLEERLECLRVLKYDVETERILGHSRSRGLRIEDFLEEIPALQQLMYRLLGCQPEGASTRNLVIQYAFAIVVKESFKLYCVINDGIINLVDKFFELPKHDALKALDVYKRTGQQTEKLSAFYDACRGLELARSFQFPSLAQLPPSFLATMEEYVKEAPRGLALPKALTDLENGVSGPPRLMITYRENDDEAERESSFSPALVSAPNPHKEDVNGLDSENSDLLGLGQQHQQTSSLEESNALALAIIPAEVTSNGASSFYDSSNGNTGWELALVTEPSSNESALASSKLAGGMDNMTLDSLYASSAALAPSGYPVTNNPFEARSPQHDPFFASTNMAPPTGVQMAQHEQTYMQQMMLIPHGVTNNPFGTPDFSFSNTTPHGFQNNPFGNPALL